MDIKRFSQSATEQSKMTQLVQGMHDIKLNNCGMMCRLFGYQYSETEKYDAKHTC